MMRSRSHKGQGLENYDTVEFLSPNMNIYLKLDKKKSSSSYETELNTKKQRM